MSHMQTCSTHYVGKSKMSFNVTLNNHREDSKNFINFNNHEHTLSKHGKFITIQQLRNANTTPSEALKLRLKKR